MPHGDAHLTIELSDAPCPDVGAVILEIVGFSSPDHRVPPSPDREA
jgi:hypothetical protein